MGDDEDEIPTGTVSIASEDAPQLCAVITIDGVVATHVLPQLGELEIGRASSCDVVVGHPSVSRSHATLRTSPLTITDLGSRNGTWLRGETLAAHDETPFAIGEAFQLGQVSVLVQPRHHSMEESTGASERSTEALVRQLEMECARSARSGSPFAYARLIIEQGDAPYEQLRAALRATDVVAGVGGVVELLLPETSSDHVTRAIERVHHLLAEHRSSGRIAVARYPFDGTTAEALIARVWEQLDAPIPAPATDMDAVRAMIAQVATSDVSVLITGETGVGKELCAEMIHRQSRRATRPFMKLNCSTLTESLIDSELFGHERGAFTGAMSTRHGLFEASDGGTVFLDEIGELPLPAQAKLLRVLEDRRVRRVGSTVDRELDVRFVGATNRLLIDEVEAGRFRRDLYDRISGVTITVPPLRERVGEIAGLARAFAARPRGSTSGAKKSLGEDVLAALRQHPWRGNIRELRNTVERAVLLAGDRRVKAEDLTLDPSSPGRSSVPTMPMDRITLTELSRPTAELAPLASSVAEVERRRILDALDQCGGNQTRAARMLGISRNTLLARLDTYGLPRPRKS